MERKESLLERASQALELPGDALGGMPRIELLGDRELRMEAHKGILAYGDEEILISGGKLVVRVRGRLRWLRGPIDLDMSLAGVLFVLERGHRSVSAHRPGHLLR